MEKQRVCANGPAMSRRTLLAAIPATTALALPVSASVEDPILPHYREWLAARQEWEDASELPGNGNFEFPESIATQERVYAAQDRMAEITPTTSAGIAALLHLHWIEYGPYEQPGSEEYDEQCAQSGHNLLLQAWRGAAGVGGASFPEQLHASA